MSRSRQVRRDRKRVERRRSARAGRARETQRRQAAAAAAGRATRGRRRGRAYALWTLAAVLGVVDVFVYVGALPFMSADAATAVFGLPAAMLAILGAIAYGT